MFEIIGTVIVIIACLKCVIATSFDSIVILGMIFIGGLTIAGINKLE